MSILDTEWLVLLRPKSMPDGSCDVVVIVEAIASWEAPRLALETRNIPNDWRVMQVERG